MPNRLVDIPGARLFVVDEGTGPPIVLLHAGVADQRSWDAVVPRLVAAGYRVITYDARGFGRSTSDDSPFSYRADLVAILDALAIERAVLVGNSLGGQTAFDAAIEFPARVAAVVGVGAGVGGFDGESTPAEREILEAYGRIDAAEPFDPDALTDFEAGVWLDGPGQPRGRVDPSTRASFLAMAGPSTSGPGRPARSASSHRPSSGWSSCAAPSSPLPERSTSPRWPRPLAAWKPMHQTPRRSSGPMWRT